MASLSKGTSFTDGVTGDVTAAKLHALVDAATPVGGLISDRTAKTSVASADTLLLGDSADSGNLKKITVSNLVGTLPTASITTGTILTATLGTTTGTSAIFTSGTLTTGVIPTATLGTTTGTAATFTSGTIPTLTAGTTTSTAANFTTGTVQTLTASTATITNGTYGGLLNNSTGTFLGSVNSTTGTIGNLTTTLAGDFTISSGTGTLGTTGVTAGTYGTNTSAVTLSVDAKGRITTVSTSTIQTTPADGSITYAKLSTSSTESENVAKRTAKAWVSNGGSGASFNVSSVAYNTPSTGITRVNFSSNIGTSYMAICNVGNRSTDGGAGMPITYNTGYVDFFNKIQGQSATNWGNIDAVVFGS